MLSKLIDRSNGGCYFVAAKLLIGPVRELSGLANVVGTSTGTAWNCFAVSGRGMVCSSFSIGPSVCAGRKGWRLLRLGDGGV
jgi:hypothetical protein